MKSIKGKYNKIGTGMYQHSITKRYQAVKRVPNKKHPVRKTFTQIKDAKRWRKIITEDDIAPKQNRTHTLNEVFQHIQKRHFPTLAESTREINIRKYELLSQLGEYPMECITSSVITKWVEKNVEFFKSDKYAGSSRGKSKRCNLNSELNYFTTIFNWYKSDEEFEYEAKDLLNPVKTKHKKLGIIRQLPVVNKAITLEHAMAFFEELDQPYRDLAMFQFFTASRIGEVAGLQWHRVNLDMNNIIIMETARWSDRNKMFVALNPHPKNKEPRYVHITKLLEPILNNRTQYQEKNCDFVFHVEGRPLNYCTIQSHYRKAQRRANIPYTGTQILRHGMAKLARQVGGGLDAVMAITGHKDIKMANHYSKTTNEDQKNISNNIENYIINKQKNKLFPENVFPLQNVVSARL